MTLFNTIKNAIPPVHHEGYPFIAAFFVATIVAGWLWSPLFYLGLGLTIWCALFYRDPERITPIDKELVISPADGRVSYIGHVVPPKELDMGDEEALRISIFMNVFNCHINRAPVEGKIEDIIYKHGSFLNAELDKASEQNERNAITIDSSIGKVAVVQIAGLVARRIVCWAQEGEGIAAGERFGLIRFGSRLDVYLPKAAKVQVDLGQTAIGGETVIARMGARSKTPLTRKS